MIPDGQGYDEPLRFRGGLAGALLPFALFVAGVAFLALSGAPEEKGFWPVELAALAAALLLARDRRRYSRAVVDGMSRPVVLLMVLAWLLAGVLASLMNASGFVESLLWLARQAQLSGGGWTAAAFLAAAVVSSSTGTSLGTLILCVPLLYPAGVAVGADPFWLLGALLGGATFGDNISPVSDTTIASATTQGAEIGDVVRTRMRYALPAAAVALVAFALLGGGGDVADAGATASPAGLPMLLAPAVVLALLLARRHLFEGLLLGAVVAVAVAIACGLIAPTELVYIDAEAFGARGLIVAGVERSLGLVVFTFLLMGLLGGLEEAGVLERLVRGLDRGAASSRAAETRAVVATSAATLVTTHSVVALLAVGPFVRRAGELEGSSAVRRANLLDLTVCTWPFLLPYCIPTLLAAALASGTAHGPRLSALDAGLANLHSWGLLGMLILAVATGYGRRRDAS